ncbi:polypyrimidine tract-binding protein homolog 3 [Tanacetum coccineum]
MASGGSDWDAKGALSKLLQRGTVAEYHTEFEMLISRVTGKSESLLQMIYISGLKLTLQIELLRARPTTLGEAFSLAHITKARFKAIEASAFEELKQWLSTTPVLSLPDFNKVFVVEADAFANRIGMSICRIGKSLFRNVFVFNAFDYFFRKSWSSHTLEVVLLSETTPKLALQCALLRSNSKTLDEAFSLARAMEACFTNLQLSEFLRSNPSTLGEAFFKARIIEAYFEVERPTIAITKPNDVTAKVQLQDLEQTNQGRGDEPNRILLVTIHQMLYPITMEVLHQVFSPHGYVVKVIIFQKSARVQALIQFQSRRNAIATRNSLQGCNIYEGCCQLDIQFSNLEELQPNQNENICYYYWDICSLTPAEEVVDSGHSSTFSSLVEHESVRVLQLWEIIGIGDVHELMDNKGIYNFVQLNAGERMRLQAMVTGRRTRGSEDHRRKPRGKRMLEEEKG